MLWLLLAISDCVIGRIQPLPFPSRMPHVYILKLQRCRCRLVHCTHNKSNNGDKSGAHTNMNTSVWTEHTYGQRSSPAELQEACSAQKYAIGFAFLSRSFMMHNFSLNSRYDVSYDFNITLIGKSLKSKCLNTHFFSRNEEKRTISVHKDSKSSGWIPGVKPGGPLKNLCGGYVTFVFSHKHEKDIPLLGCSAGLRPQERIIWMQIIFKYFCQEWKMSSL